MLEFWRGPLRAEGMGYPLATAEEADDSYEWFLSGAPKGVAWTNRRSIPMDQNLSMFLAPWGLALACGLMAVGGLSLFGIDFLKTRSQAIAALVAGVFVLAATELLMIADSGAYFFQAQKIQVSQCYIEGEGAFPAERASKDNDAGRYIKTCVTKLGYEWDPAHQRCKEFEVPMNAHCYLPTGLVSRAVTKFQLLFE